MRCPVKLCIIEQVICIQWSRCLVRDNLLITHLFCNHLVIQRSHVRLYPTSPTLGDKVRLFFTTSKHAKTSLHKMLNWKFGHKNTNKEILYHPIITRTIYNIYYLSRIPGPLPSSESRPHPTFTSPFNHSSECESIPLSASIVVMRPLRMVVYEVWL